VSPFSWLEATIIPHSGTGKRAATPWWQASCLPVKAASSRVIHLPLRLAVTAQFEF
jgi:hypothetical protein